MVFEAWLDETNRIVSFHKIPDSRMIIDLILAGYRVQ